MTSEVSRDNAISDIASASGSPLSPDAVTSVRRSAEGRYIDSVLDATPTPPITID